MKQRKLSKNNNQKIKNTNEHRNFQIILYFIDYFDDWKLSTERMRRWNSRVSYFLFLSCLWEEGRLTGYSLYLAAEGENSRI